MISALVIEKIGYTRIVTDIVKGHSILDLGVSLTLAVTACTLFTNLLLTVLIGQSNYHSADSPSLNSVLL